MANDNIVDIICECYEKGQEIIEVEEVLSVEMQQKVVEVAMCVPEPKPCIKQVIDVLIKDVKIKSVDILTNKVIVRGDFEVKVMYVAALPDEPVHAFEQRHVKFTRDIDVPGAQPGMSATADCTVEYVGYDFMDSEPCRINVTVVLKCWTRVTKTSRLEVESAQIEPETAYQAAESEMTVITPEAAGTNLSIDGSTGTITGNNVNVRTGPGLNYPSLTKVGRNTAVTIKEQAFGWYKVTLPDGMTGWIAGWFVKIE